MPEPKHPRRIRFYADGMLADALMNSIFLIMCIGTCSLFLVSSNDLLFVYFMCYLLSVPAAVLFILRRLSLPVIPMILLHFAVALAVPLLFVTMGTSVILVTSIAGTALMVYSLSCLFRKAAVQASPSLLLFSFFMHLFCLFISYLRSISTLTPYILSGFLISICLFLAVRQILSFQNGFDHFLSSSTQPGKLIQSNNNRIIIILCIVSGLILPLSLIFPYDFIVDFFRFIGKYIVIFILYLFSLVPAATGESKETDPDYKEGCLFDFSRTSSGIIAVILEYIVIGICVFFIAYGLYKLVPAAISFMRKFFRKSNRTEKLMGSHYVTDETIDLEKNTIRKNKKLPAFGTGEEQKVRKEYYRTVKGAIAKGAKITGASSSEDIQITIFDQFGKDISELTIRYEKVRYGPRNQSQNGHLQRKR